MSREKLHEVLDDLDLWDKTITIKDVEIIADRYRKKLNEYPEDGKWTAALRLMEIGDTFYSNKERKHMATIICQFCKRKYGNGRKYSLASNYENGIFVKTTIERIK